MQRHCSVFQSIPIYTFSDLKLKDDSWLWKNNILPNWLVSEGFFAFNAHKNMVFSEYISKHKAPFRPCFVEYLHSLQIWCAHNGSLVEFNRCKVSFEQALQFQIWWFSVGGALNSILKHGKWAIFPWPKLFLHLGFFFVCCIKLVT